jgi:hypothetical protein
MSHFLLIEKLVPLLEESNFAKLLFLNSFFHFGVYGQDLNTSSSSSSPSPPLWIYANTTCPHPFFRDQYMYGSSKFAMMLHAEILRARHSKLNVVSADPGWTATNLNGERGSILHLPLQWIGFPVMGWGLASPLHALFSLDDHPTTTNGGSNTIVKTTTAPKTYFSNAQNYYILPLLFNSQTWRERIPRWVKVDLRLRDWIVVVQGFALGFLQRFHYEAFAMPPSIETTDVQLQSTVYAWSQQVVAEWLE